MTNFDIDIIIAKIGENVVDSLRKHLEKKGLSDRMDDENGIFLINSVTILSIKDEGIECKVEYDYGG